MEDAVNSITSVNTMLVGVVISIYFNRSNVTSSYNRSIEQSDFTVGYIHGATDAHQPDTIQWYILEPGKGFAHHSWDFVKGYVYGFCSVSPGTSSDSDKASWDCSSGLEQKKYVIMASLSTFISAPSYAW